METKFNIKSVEAKKKIQTREREREYVRYALSFRVSKREEKGRKAGNACLLGAY